jgi:hypothetical protein
MTSLGFIYTYIYIYIYTHMYIRKGKVAPLLKALFHEGVWRLDIRIHEFLTSALVGEWSASCPSRFTLEEEPPVSIG